MDRIIRLADRIAPLLRRRRPPVRESPAGPKLEAGRGLVRREEPQTKPREYVAIVFWTLVVVGIALFIVYAVRPR